MERAVALTEASCRLGNRRNKRADPSREIGARPKAYRRDLRARLSLRRPSHIQGQFANGSAKSGWASRKVMRLTFCTCVSTKGAIYRPSRLPIVNVLE